MTFKELLKDKAKKKSFTIRYAIFSIILFIPIDILVMNTGIDVFAKETHVAHVLFYLYWVIKCSTSIGAFILGILFWKQPFMHYIHSLFAIFFCMVPCLDIISLPILCYLMMGSKMRTSGSGFYFPPYPDKESRYK